jgi:hypothetical protein
MEPEISSPCSETPSIDLCSEQVQSSSQLHIYLCMSINLGRLSGQCATSSILFLILGSGQTSEQIIRGVICHLHNSAEVLTSKLVTFCGFLLLNSRVRINSFMRITVLYISQLIRTIPHLSDGYKLLRSK